MLLENRAPSTCVDLSFLRLLDADFAGSKKKKSTTEAKPPGEPTAKPVTHPTPVKTVKPVAKPAAIAAEASKPEVKPAINAVPLVTVKPATASKENSHP